MLLLLNRSLGCRCVVEVEVCLCIHFLFRTLVYNDSIDLCVCVCLFDDVQDSPIGLLINKKDDRFDQLSNCR